MIRRLLIALSACSMLAACGPGKPDQLKGHTPKELTFSILSAENQSSMQPLWQPLLDDMSQQIGVPVKPFFATNYTSLIEAMRFGQVQVGWFSALPALEAVRRADGQVLGRVIDSGGIDSYTSVLIVKKGSGITLDDVLKCDKTLSFGLGDAKSTSGTLAPMTYLFAPRGIEPANCFKNVRSASHQVNVNSVALGQLDVATNNSVGLVFAKRENAKIGNAIQVIWESPPLPESSIVVKRDLDPALKEKIRQFFLTYGVGDDARAEAQRKVLKQLAYGGFRPADDSYLDPIREMEASTELAEAKHSGDKDRVAKAQAAFDQVRAKAAQHRAIEPTAG